MHVWVLTAVPVGFLFGFFLQKGDLCGASAFSEVLVMKDRRKLFGLWMLIVTAMLAFALLQMLGWALMSVGMILFGVVTILANWITSYYYLLGGQLAGSFTK
jgi:hypothetical protein